MRRSFLHVAAFFLVFSAVGCSGADHEVSDEFDDGLEPAPTNPWRWRRLFPCCGGGVETADDATPVAAGIVPNYGAMHAGPAALPNAPPQGADDHHQWQEWPAEAFAQPVAHHDTALEEAHDQAVTAYAVGASLAKTKLPDPKRPGFTYTSLEFGAATLMLRGSTQGTQAVGLLMLVFSAARADAIWRDMRDLEERYLSEELEERYVSDDV